MNFAKFMSLLQNRGLFFSRVDCLGDAWEGALPSATAGVFRDVVDAIVEVGDESMRQEIKGSWSLSYGAARSRTYTSCWQAAPRDVWWMWKVYCESEFGVAIRSTYELLDEMLPVEILGDRHIMLGCVSYGDYDSTDYVTQVSSVYSAVMSKRDAFQDEREVRALCDAAASSEQSNGFFVQVDLNRLVTAVVVSPLAPTWFRATVEGAVRAMKIACVVEDSRLRREPSLPF